MGGADVGEERSALQSSPFRGTSQNPLLEVITACQQVNTPPAASRTDPGVQSGAAF